eukprot:gene238-116_t
MSVPANAVAAMVSALNQAGFAMLHHLAASDAAGNLFLSPFSVGGAFGLAYTGAAGDTAAQIRTALGFPDGGVDACGELFATLHAAYAALDRIKVFVSNSIWADAALPVLPAYLDAVQRYYGGAFYQEDFAQGAAVAAKINAYVEDRTSRMIQNLLSSHITRNTSMVLLNTLYFEADWANPFCADDTSDQPFALPGGGTRTVRLMYQKVRLPYFVDDTAAAHGVVLPYKDPRFALIAVMPLEPGADQGVAGLDRLVARLAGDAATHLHLPRTTLAYKAELSGPLQSLGIADAFTPRADFSGITAPSQLVVSSVIHQTALQMDEVSTRAAAATAMVMECCCLVEEDPPKEFRADRPFLVLIRDMDTGLVLFEGRLFVDIHWMRFTTWTLQLQSFSCDDVGGETHTQAHAHHSRIPIYHLLTHPNNQQVGVRVGHPIPRQDPFHQHSQTPGPPWCSHPPSQHKQPTHFTVHYHPKGGGSISPTVTHSAATRRLVGFCPNPSFHPTPQTKSKKTEEKISWWPHAPPLHLLTLLSYIAFCMPPLFILTPGTSTIPFFPSFYQSTRMSSPTIDCCSCCAAVRRLEEQLTKAETENVFLRRRLQEMELMAAVISAKSTGVPVVSVQSFEDERRRVAQLLEPHTFKVESPSNYNDLPTYPVRPHFDKATANPATKVVIFDGCPNDPNHPSSMPIYQTSTFVQPAIGEFGPYDYSRSGNPTRTAAETLLADLEGATAAFAFSSGMAALQTLLTTLQAGDAIVTGSDLYGGMHRLLTRVTANLGVEVCFINTWDLDAVRQIFVEKKNIRLVHLESPTNPLMRVIDIRAVCEIAHAHNCRVSIDSTIMSPMRCTPIALGCDYVVHSGTKFLAGHSDIMCGVVCAKTEEEAKRIAFLQNSQGNALAPFDCWLLLRGLKTMSIRVDRQEMNAMAVAFFLARQTHFIKKLNYVGLDPSVFPDISGLTKEEYDRHRAQSRGPSSLLSFETGDVEVSQRFVQACKLFKLTVSFGSCNSLVEMPCLLSHASIPAAERTLPDDLVRLSIGIEQIEDLLADLRQAIDEACCMCSNALQMRAPAFVPILLHSSTSLSFPGALCRSHLPMHHPQVSSFLRVQACATRFQQLSLSRPYKKPMRVNGKEAEEENP